MIKLISLSHKIPSNISSVNLKAILSCFARISHLSRKMERERDCCELWMSKMNEKNSLKCSKISLFLSFFSLFADYWKSAELWSLLKLQFTKVFLLYIIIFLFLYFFSAEQDANKSVTIKSFWASLLLLSLPSLWGDLFRQFRRINYTFFSCKMYGIA